MIAAIYGTMRDQNENKIKILNCSFKSNHVWYELILTNLLIENYETKKERKLW